MVNQLDSHFEEGHRALEGEENRRPGVEVPKDGGGLRLADPDGKIDGQARWWSAMALVSATCRVGVVGGGIGSRRQPVLEADGGGAAVKDGPQGRDGHELLK